MMKINDSFAAYTLEMLMVFQAAVVPFDIATAFDDKSLADFSDGQQRSVDGIQGDVRNPLSDLFKDGVGGWMVFGFYQNLVNRYPLRCNF